MIIIFFLISCSDTKIINDLQLYHGVSQIIKQDSDTLCFLTNLKEYNNIMALCYINKKGELLKVHPVDKYLNVDVESDFIKLINNNGYLNLIYENKGTEVILESFNGLSLYKKVVLKKQLKTYGTLLQIGEEKRTAFIKSSYLYNSTDHSSYKYNYFMLDENYEILENGLVDLGQFYPMGMLLLNNKIFYYIDNRHLLYKSLGGGITSVYNFEKDIIQIRQLEEKILVLLSDSIYIVSENGELSKGFNLIEDESDYKADFIINSDGKHIIVKLSSDSETIYKIFSYFGSQISEYQINSKTVGESYILEDGNDIKILYSKNEHLYLKDF